MNDEMGKVGRAQKTENLKLCVGRTKLNAVINNHQTPQLNTM